MQRLIDTLIELWLYDVSVLSQPWLLWTVLPAIFYIVFMLLKWAVLTCPLWLPLAIIFGSLRN